jgi:putative alpha-1,2-mannosidase
MLKPPNSDDPIAPDSSTKEGRGALPDWLSLSYITPKFSRAVSRAVEYAGNDFGLYQVASGLGKEDDAQKYLNRSKSWRNHWNAKQESLGFTGFVVPRYDNGSFEEPYDPLQCGGCYWGGEFLFRNISGCSWLNHSSDPFYQDVPWSSPRCSSLDRISRRTRNFRRSTRKVLRARRVRWE